MSLPKACVHYGAQCCPGEISSESKWCRVKRPKGSRSEKGAGEKRWKCRAFVFSIMAGATFAPGWQKRQKFEEGGKKLTLAPISIEMKHFITYSGQKLKKAWRTIWKMGEIFELIYFLTRMHPNSSTRCLHLVLHSIVTADWDQLSTPLFTPKSKHSFFSSPFKWTRAKMRPPKAKREPRADFGRMNFWLALRVSQGIGCGYRA